MAEFSNHYIITSPPEDVYLALTNPNTIELWSGEEAEMSTEVGSEFSLWEDSIVGKNLEFVLNEKIVQQWYFGEENPESIVTITLKEHKKGTIVYVTQTNIPEDDLENIAEGWNEAYFGSIIEFYKD